MWESDDLDPARGCLTTVVVGVVFAVVVFILALT